MHEPHAWLKYWGLEPLGLYEVGATGMSIQAVFFQFHLEDRWSMDECKLGMISQELLKIEVKLLYIEC